MSSRVRSLRSLSINLSRQVSPHTAVRSARLDSARLDSVRQPLRIYLKYLGQDDDGEEEENENDKKLAKTKLGGITQS